MMSTTTEKEEQQKVQLYDEATLKSMTRWYDQQIALATKSKELASLSSFVFLTFNF